MSEPTVYEHLRAGGLSRRDFMKFCGIVSGWMGLELLPGVKAMAATPEQVAEALKSKPRVPVIWLELQDCAGCTEALSRSQSPSLVNLVLASIAVDYHETLMAAAGFQAEASMRATMEKYKGQYVLVVEGSLPTAADGVYCTVAGRSGTDILREAAAGAAAVIATGNCAAFGGLPKADPNPTGALGVDEFIKDKPIINIPGCPAIPEVTTGTIAHFLVMGALPKTDSLKRPLAFYGHTIHDHCLRRPFYDAGKFAGKFDDDDARAGHCLYKLGCKGPTTYNACSSLKWEKGLSFPVQSGHPCLGCSEPNFWDGGGFYQAQSAPTDRPTAAAFGLAAGVGAALGAAMAGANSLAKRKAGKAAPAEPKKAAE
jgi:hydrogenase small subunit